MPLRSGIVAISLAGCPVDGGQDHAWPDAHLLARRLNAGGAVGFLLLPVTNEQVIPGIETLIASLDPVLNRLLLATVDQALAGWLLLVGNADMLTAHWARVLGVQTAPEHRGTGLGRD